MGLKLHADSWSLSLGRWRRLKPFGFVLPHPRRGFLFLSEAFTPLLPELLSHFFYGGCQPFARCLPSGFFYGGSQLFCHRFLDGGSDFFCHGFHRPGTQRLKPGNLLANLFRPLSTRHPGEKFSSPCTHLHKQPAFVHRGRGNGHDLTREIRQAFELQRGKLLAGALDGFHIEIFIFDVQNQILDMARALDVKSVASNLNYHRGSWLRSYECEVGS